MAPHLEPTHQRPPEAHLNNEPPPPPYTEHTPYRQPDNRPSDYVRTWFGARKGSPLRNAYSYFASYGWTRWVVDLVTVILSAVILTKDPSRDLFIAAVYTIAAVSARFMPYFFLTRLVNDQTQFGVSLPLLAPRIKPRSPTDPRPAAWVAYALALTRVVLIPSIGLMAYNYAMEPGRRNYRRSFDEFAASHSKRYVYNASGPVEYRLALVCAACGVASV